ncbi:hypothetical protein CDG79_14460 [Nostoc sp. 'Peltigera membranacea cyanobiont' 232]|nr:hypothetical protein CDG79_14460 [Nostoc sp. 'Peltigera membranacea cyanobiont' 232]
MYENKLFLHISTEKSDNSLEGVERCDRTSSHSTIVPGVSFLKRKKPQNIMFHGFQCGVRSLSIYHDKVTTQQQRTRNNFGNRLFFAMILSGIRCRGNTLREAALRLHELPLP